MHVALMGDSIFDNRAYTAGEPDVATHLRDLLPSSSNVTLCAVDGSTTSELTSQLDQVPANASHIVVSIGGNDALMNGDLLNTPVASTRDALSLFASRVGKFEASYRAALDEVLGLDRPTAICTIYNGNLNAGTAHVARVALMMFNDTILRFGFERRLPVIDLRFVCCEKMDYANPIEPSGSGGRKIAKAIAAWLDGSQSRKPSEIHIG